MFSLEDHLLPCEPSRPDQRDALGLAVLAALAIALLPAWLSQWSLEEHLAESAIVMGSHYFLTAMGFLLALRVGAIDVSVWVCAAAGGLVSAMLIHAQQPPILAALAGAAAGLALGLINGLLVAFARIPSILATSATALIVMFSLNAFVTQRQLTVPTHTFNSWRIAHHSPILHIVVILFLLILAGRYFMTMMERSGVTFSRRWQIVGALSLSGLLAATAGVCWLIEHDQAPIATRPVGDLRILAAALLAGGLYHTGPTRTLLTLAILPVSLLIATAWRQNVWNPQVNGYSLQMAVLAGMIFVIHRALAALTSRKPKAQALFAIASVLTSGGMIVLAANTQGHTPQARNLLSLIGVILWAVGAALLVIAYGVRRSATPPTAPNSPEPSTEVPTWTPSTPSRPHDDAGTHR